MLFSYSAHLPFTTAIDCRLRNKKKSNILRVGGDYAVGGTKPLFPVINVSRCHKVFIIKSDLCQKPKTDLI